MQVAILGPHAESNQQVAGFLTTATTGWRAQAASPNSLSADVLIIAATIDDWGSHGEALESCITRADESGLKWFLLVDEVDADCESRDQFVAQADRIAKAPLPAVFGRIDNPVSEEGLRTIGHIRMRIEMMQASASESEA